MSEPLNIDKALASPAPLKKNRRTKVEVAEKAILDCLAGENVDKLLSYLTDLERNLFYDLIAQLREHGELDMEDFWKIDYTRKPPTMEEFVNDPYWLGSVCQQSEESEGLFPEWRRVLCTDFNLESRIHNVVITGSLGTGKCVAPTTKVIMMDGTKLAKDIVVGDKVMGDDGTSRTVLSTTCGRDKMYRITPLRPKRSAGFVCNGAHILCLKGEKGDVLEISVDDYVRLTKDKPGKGFQSETYNEIKASRLYQYKLYTAPASFDKRSVKIDPYWFGLWLGDGTSFAPHMTIAAQDVEILEYHSNFAKKWGTELKKSNETLNGSCALYRITYKRGNKNPLLDELRAYGVIEMAGHGSRKHIPDDYLYNDKETRLQLLAGLIDSDGSVFKTIPGGYGIGFSIKKLADQTHFLAGSLGYSSSIRHRKVHDQNGTECDCWSVTISGAFDIPVKLPRKRSSISRPHTRRGGNRRTIGKSGFTVEHLGVGDYNGFMLDGNHRFLLDGFIVSHNSFIATLIFCYRLVLGRLLRNPHAFLGLSKGSRILYVMLSITKEAVADTIFGDAQNFMANSPFFLEECQFNPDKKYSSFVIPLGGSLFLTAGSRGQHIIGRNTLGIAMDEGNFRLEQNPDMTAYRLFNEVRTRLKNRFQRLSGYLPAISILASSSRDENSFTEQIIADVDAAKDPATQRVYRYAVYKIKAHSLKLSKRWFRVAYGLKNFEPKILEGFVNENSVAFSGERLEDPPPNAKVELVPEDYLPEFKRSATVSLQSICGISTGASYRLFSTTFDLERAVAAGEAAGCINPCKEDSFSLSDENNREIYNHLDHGIFLIRRSGQILPKRDPTAVRFAHFDLATASQAGVAVCHIVGNTVVENVYDKLTGSVFNEYRILIEYDLVLSIVAGATKPISIRKIQNLFFWLREKCGFQFGMITADTYQSALPLQILDAAGFPTELLSTVKTKEPYYAWRDAYQEGRIRMFRHFTLMREAEQLIDGPKMIDHPTGGTNDLTDACAGAYYDAFMHGRQHASTMRTGDGAISAFDKVQATAEQPPIDFAPPPGPPTRHAAVV